MLGKKSGLDSIRIKAEELGLEVPEERRARELLAEVKALGAKKRRLVTDDEFRASSGKERERPRSGLTDMTRAWELAPLRGDRASLRRRRRRDRQPLRRASRPGRGRLVLTRRREHARALEAKGLRVSGRADVHAASIRATADPDELPEFDLAIVATKGTALDAAATALEGRFPDATIDHGSERARRGADRP